MTVFLLVACWGLLKALRVDAAEEGVPDRAALHRGLNLETAVERFAID
ncbi:hypothetical protein Thimo_1558 [Thioflavicoccus mobilis 8321]|uniref:Uncharacterized protein n=1 Tax=Thioflavicoccus mobilis 8321 TaxID=765912 RepID=L0GYF0_9GAMM|nr:hypothetical protein Thimo_1558 [Thioflavicoccus mobilis 8321]